MKSGRLQGVDTLRFLVRFQSTTSGLKVCVGLSVTGSSTLHSTLEDPTVPLFPPRPL